ANTMILCRSSGGKSPRGTAAREVGQASKPSSDEARPPLAHRAGVAGEFRGHLFVGGAVGLAAAEDEATAERLSLGGGMGVGDPVELVPLVAGEADEGRAAGHRGTLLAPEDGSRPATSNTPIRPTPPGSRKGQDFHYRAEFTKRPTSPVMGPDNHSGNNHELEDVGATADTRDH